nr:type II CRISPR RNA-guided endonuclease Cas9 [Marivivens aquimaris]
MAPRSARKGQDRRLKRRALLLSELEAASLLPPEGAERDEIFALNPYELRARAAERKVTLYELGRALWHISKHRGFKSNRKAENSEDDTGLIKSASVALNARLKEEGYLTYGAYLWARLQAKQGVRVRASGENADKHYEYYPTREMLKAEFDTIWSEQAKYHDLSDALRDRLRDYTIFYQRPLKPVQPGRCTFFPDRDRLPRWHPTAQAFLILQDLANLRVIRDEGEQSLDLETRKVLFNTLNGGEKLTWNRVRGALGLPSSARLNLEEGGLKHLHFNQVAANLLGTKRKPGPLAEMWPRFNAEQREKILSKLADSESPEELVAWLAAEHGLERSVAEAVEKIHLPDKHLRFCKEVTEALVAEMHSDVIDYSEAVLRAPLLSAADMTHSDFRPANGLNTLPRYNELEHLRRMLGNGTGDLADPHDKRYGKITNPTVHIALGQFRRVMNMLINEFGKPAEVVLEAARDLNKSPKEKDEIDKLIKANTKRNDRYRAELEEAKLLKPGQRVGDLFLKMRLWEELGRNEADRRSPFSGRLISRVDLLSDAVEIEHILPFAETFDDSPANKTLAFRKENQRKGKLSPGEAAERGIFDQQQMTELTKHFPRNKAWRFQPDAMAVFEEQKSFSDRQLHATGYLARVVRAYAETLFDKTDTDGSARNHVWMLPGRMTAMLRHRWGLNLGDHNRKNRYDHRHHAIDAAVIGVIDPPMIKRLQDAARSVGAETLSRVLPVPPMPFDGYRDQVISAIDRVNVSHRAKHGSADPTDPSRTSGRLHEDTAFGIIRRAPENQADLTIGNVVVRKPVASLSEKEIGQIRDVQLRHSVLAATEPAREAGLTKRDADKLRAEKLEQWIDEHGHRRVRIIKRESSVRPVCDQNGRPYKFFAPGEVASIDLISFEGRWVGHGQSVWDANSGQQQPWEELYPDGQFVMRLRKGDTLQLFDWDDDQKKIAEGSNVVKRIVRLAPGNNRIYLCGLNDAGRLQQRHDDDDDDFGWDLAGFDKLRLRRARRVRIDELGRVHTIPHGTV